MRADENVHPARLGVSDHLLLLGGAAEAAEHLDAKGER